jgi:glucokinase
VGAARAGDAGSRAALGLFLTCWGAAAGAIALTIRAEAGLWLVGGISAHLSAELSTGPFLAAFRAQGRMEALAREIPVRVVTERRLGLLGAATLAARA